MVVVVLRVERPRRPPPTRTPAPATSHVEAPLPPEPPWGPLKVPNANLPAGVDAVLAAKCRRCHGAPTRHSAPFSLYTWTDTRAVHNGQPIYQRLGNAVETGFMPQLIPANPPVEKLTDAERQTLLAWVSAGAPSQSDLATAAPVPPPPRAQGTKTSRPKPGR
jgi:hypothetical protein